MIGWGPHLFRGPCFMMKLRRRGRGITSHRIRFARFTGKPVRGSAKSVTAGGEIYGLNLQDAELFQLSC